MESIEREKREGSGGDRQLANSRNSSSPVRVANVVMEVVLSPARPRSWKDCLIGTGLRADREDIVRSSINGIPAIYFSERINQILIKDMEHTVVIKLLGRNIGYAALQKKICTLWRLSETFRLMYIENG
ncbi:hypothetical protein Goari_004138 [Gossypium aridum]|uniref:Uncharacterized protein n=1 Tax=Gossypium aridum TaxID=34290 RepID=A0A7J8Y491_GOSAI|nr:hypothetical protein [Gossypium aridum]